MVPAIGARALSITSQPDLTLTPSSGALTAPADGHSKEARDPGPQSCVADCGTGDWPPRYGPAMNEAQHAKNCQCEDCQRYRLVQHYGYVPSPRRGGAGWKIPVILLLSGLFLATAMSFFDANLNFPVISQTVCSIKGDTWYGGGILGAPGCYAPSP